MFMNCVAIDNIIVVFYVYSSLLCVRETYNVN